MVTLAASSNFERVAAVVTERAAEILGADVSVVDEVGVVVASSKPSAIGLPFGAAFRDPDGAYVRIPMRLDAQAGEVIMAEPANGEVIPPRLAQALVDLIINQTAVVERLPNQNELKDKFIYDLLHGAHGDEADVLREAQILGMDFMRPRAVILIEAADFIRPRAQAGQPAAAGSPHAGDPLVRRRSQLVIASVVGFFNLRNDTICAYIGNGEVAVLKASGTQDLAAWIKEDDGPDQTNSSWANLIALKRAGAALHGRLRRDTNSTITIGIGRYHPGIRGLARSYEDARAALVLGRRFQGDNRVHCLDSLGVAAFVGLADESTKVDLAKHLLSPLDQDPDLLRTVDAFFAADCSPSATAQRLAIHRNTLSYRLDKIASFAGLDPRHFDAAVQIRLALILRALHGNPIPQTPQALQSAR